MDETHIRIRGHWRDLYRAVDKHGHTMDFLLTEQRDEPAAMRFLTKAIRRYGVPETMSIDAREANAAMRGCNEAHGTAIIIRRIKYLHNILEQEHRTVKRATRPMLSFKSFEAVRCALTGIQLMHMLKKGQMTLEERVKGLTPWLPDPERSKALSIIPQKL
jgi:putative transposase